MYTYSMYSCIDKYIHLDTMDSESLGVIPFFKALSEGARRRAGRIVAMENPRTKWWFLAGKIIYKWAIFHGYVK